MREGPAEPLGRGERDERDEEYGELERQPDWWPRRDVGDFYDDPNVIEKGD